MSRAAAVAAFPTVRQSYLAAFDRCERAAFLDHEFADYHTHAQGRGSLFHATAAECLRLMVVHNTPVIDVDLAYDILEEQIRQHDTPPGDRLPVPARELAELRITVKKWATDNSFSVHNVVGIEERLQHEVHYVLDGEVIPRTLTGQLDVLLIDASGEATVIDWKDTWALPGPSDVSEGGYFQQRFYAMLVFAAYPAVHTVTLREFYPRYSEARTATIGREKLPDLEAEFSALVDRFDAAWEAHLTDPPERAEVEPWVAPAFAPSPGAHCSYCTMPERCPIMPHARGAGSVTDEAAAEDAAAQLLVAKAIVKKNTDALKAWCGEHGPVPVKDAKRPRVMGFRPVTRTSRPTYDQTMAALEAAESPEQGRQLLDGLYKTTTGTQFTDYDPTRQESA